MYSVGTTSVTGKQLVADTVDVVVGGKTTEQVAIGGQSTKKTVVVGQNVDIGAASATVTIGFASPEVSIGSLTGVINLRGTEFVCDYFTENWDWGLKLWIVIRIYLGKVTLNGNAFESRRRLSAAETWVGYLNADRFVIEAASSTSEFALPFSDRFVSQESAIQFNANDGDAAFQILGSESEAASGHVKVSLNLDGVRLQTSSGSTGPPTNSKLR